ncbi:MAG: 2-oxo acid dehydrogenase subunit E2 [Fimbriimonadaceae bacterium]|nr:2-oxo acid dehydrogenase subunit E2 [Fimbriimonadaceae bacterium]
MTEVIMPKMGDGMEEGTLLEWLKKDGDKVKSGDIIGTIQTDKATLELESPGSGSLTGFLIKEGDTVPVGKPIAILLKEGEALPENWGSGSSPASKSEEKTTEPAPAANGASTASAPTAASTAPSQASTAPAGRVKASPLAKRIAAELGVDLTAISGSGPGGRIVEKDVRAAAGSTTAKTAPATAAAINATAEDQLIPLNKIRQITAQRTVESKQQIPHFYVTVDVDVDRLMALRKTFEEEGAGKVSVNDFVVKACALALREMPMVNSSYQGDKLIQYGAVNIGMAVALDDGLTVAVIRNADQMTLRQINARAKELAGKARENRLSMDELTGSTFSISNMGMLDVDSFIAIVNQPNSGILAVSSARKTVVVNHEEQVVISTRMNISASFDHRVVDGAIGAKFINVVRSYLENPTRLLS